MSIVGAFPGLDNKRRTVREPVNPLDKSTVVSILPKVIDEYKPTIQPGRFMIPPGSYVVPSILIVTPSSWWREIDDEQPLLEIPVSSIKVADSIVNDYCNGLLACDMVDVKPGLFYLPGEIKLDKVLTEHRARLDKAYAGQKLWYAALVKMADMLWSRSNGNPLAISDDMRLAARELGFNTKEWLQDFQNQEQIRCTACGSFRNAAFPVCPTCKAVVDVKKASDLKLKFVE